MIRPLVLVASVCVLAAACGNAAPVKTAAAPAKLCKDGDRVCKGNYVAECATGGNAYKLTFCADKTCNGGECKATVCSKGQLTCNDQNVMKCPDDGLTEASKIQTCKQTGNPTEKCNDGVCLPSACFKGDPAKSLPPDAKCGNTTLYVCTNGVWGKGTVCGSNQFCDAAARACADRVCVPTQAQCKDDKTAQVCNSAGGAWVDQACPGSEGCFDGICHAKVAATGTTGSDATTSTADAPVGEKQDTVAVGTGDTLVKPKKDVVFDAPDVFKVTFSKTKTPGAGDAETKFDFASAGYLPVLKALQVSGDKELFKIELQIGPMDDFTTTPTGSSYTQAGGEMGETKIFCNDGTNDQTKVQWLWGAVDYDIVVDQFDDVGGRISGKFSAELINQVDKKSKAYLTNGVFDIKRN